jgi:hypothetical protein
MSGEVLTTASVITCGHGGRARPAAAHRLTVGGVKVLTTSGFAALTDGQNPAPAVPPLVPPPVPPATPFSPPMTAKAEQTWLKGE